MYARISRAKIKPGMKAEVGALTKVLEGRTRGLPGLSYWGGILTKNGELTVIALFEDGEACRAYAETNARRWSDAGDLFLAAPEISEGEVLSFIRAG